MKYARHAPGSARVHLKYVRPALRDATVAYDDLIENDDDKPPSIKNNSWSAMFDTQLLNDQKDTMLELTSRHS